MKFRRNYRYDLDEGVRYALPQAMLLFVLCFGLFLGVVTSWLLMPRPPSTEAPNSPRPAIERLILRPLMNHSTSMPAATPSAPANRLMTPHTVTTTVFWVGETSNAENAYISNASSYWDDQWQQHFGGSDKPTSRHDYYPAAFTPMQNPFYIALPYGDVTASGTRKANGTACKAFALNTADNISWCKNSWIKIDHGGHTVYAQWEDVGPNDEDDAGYVFGTAPPRNTFGAHAGLDVSPAVRDYLNLQDVDVTSWQFVSPQDVPDGPWRQTITTYPYYFQ